MNYDDVDVPAESRQAWDAIREGDLHTVERWLDTGVDPSALLVPENDTTAPLFLALAPGGMIRDMPSQLDVIRLLVAHGADINCRFTLDVMPGVGDDEMRYYDLAPVDDGVEVCGAAPAAWTTKKSGVTYACRVLGFERDRPGCVDRLLARMRATAPGDRHTPGCGLFNKQRHRRPPA